MFAYIFGLLFLYWLIKIIVCRSTGLIRVGRAALAVLSLILFLILPKEFAWPLLVIGAMLTFSLLRSIKNKGMPFRLSPFLGWCTFYSFGAVAALLSAVFQYHQEEVIGHLILKGCDRSTWMSWKNPAQKIMEEAWIPSYQVEIQNAKGKQLYSNYIPGDFVGVRAQVITIYWPYRLLGFSNLYRLELVHNGYSTAERHRFFPHTADELPFPAKIFDYLWSHLFIGSWKLPGVKSSTLESAYFPLRNPQLQPNTSRYELIIGATGLSARRTSQ